MPGSTTSASAHATFGPLPLRVFQRLVSHSGFQRCLYENPFLPFEVWSGLYTRKLPVHEALILLNRPLTKEHVTHVLETVKETRATPLLILLGKVRLSNSQLTALSKLKLSKTVANQLLHLDKVPLTSKLRIAVNAQPRQRLAWLAEATSLDWTTTDNCLTDTVVWDLLTSAVTDIQLRSVNDLPLLRTAQVFANRPALAERGAHSDDCRLIAAASLVPTSSAARDASLRTLANIQATAWSQDLVGSALDALFDRPDLSEPARASITDIAARVSFRNFSRRAVSAKNVLTSVTPITASKSELEQLFTRGAKTLSSSTPPRTFLLLELARNRNMSLDQRATLLRMLDFTQAKRELGPTRVVAIAHLTGRPLPRPSAYRVRPPRRSSNPELTPHAPASIAAFGRRKVCPNGQAMLNSASIQEQTVYLTAMLGDDPDLWLLVMTLLDNFTGTWADLVKTVRGATAST